MNHIILYLFYTNVYVRIQNELKWIFYDIHNCVLILVMGQFDSYIFSLNKPSSLFHAFKINVFIPQKKLMHKITTPFIYYNSCCLFYVLGTVQLLIYVRTSKLPVAIIQIFSYIHRYVAGIDFSNFYSSGNAVFLAEFPRIPVPAEITNPWHVHIYTYKV